MSAHLGGQAPTSSVWRMSTVERAFELARSGSCNTATEIAAELKRDNYEAVDAHLAGSSIRRSLKKHCDAAKEANRLPESTPVRKH